MRRTVEELRDFILRAHAMATERWVQSDTEMRTRIGRCLEECIQGDDVMSGFLGRGGPLADRDIMGGKGSLADPVADSGQAGEEWRALNQVMADARREHSNEFGDLEHIGECNVCDAIAAVEKVRQK